KGGAAQAVTKSPAKPTMPAAPPNPLESMARNLKNSSNQIVVEGYADANDADKVQSSLERANRAREQLVRAGLDPNKVVAIGNGWQSGKSSGVRIVEAPPPPVAQQTQAASKAGALPAEPI